MEELKINKICNTYEEQEKLQKELAKKYVVFMFCGYPTEIQEDGSFKEVYGVESIIHFGRRF